MYKLFVIVCLALLAGDSVYGQVDMFMRLKTGGAGLTYTGDSMNATYRGSDGWFEIESFSFGAENTVVIGGAGGASAGKASAAPVGVLKFPNSASAAIFNACVMGKNWPDAEIQLVKAGSTPIPFMKIELKLVMIRQTQMTVSSGDDIPNEDVELIYGAHQITFSELDSKGVLKEVGKTTWSFVNNNNTFTVD